MENTDTSSRFRTAYDFILDRVGGQARMAADGLVYWRARILTALIITGLVIGCLGFVPLTFLVAKHGMWQLAVMDVSAWTIGLSLLFAPGMRYETRAGITLFLLYAPGLFIIFTQVILTFNFFAPLLTRSGFLHTGQGLFQGIFYLLLIHFLLFPGPFFALFLIAESLFFFQLFIGTNYF